MADGEDPPKVPPLEHRFKKGQSGNPSGRPKDDPRFRSWCRKLTWETAAFIIRRIRKQPEDVSVGDATTAFKAFADRGGFLAEDRRAAIAVARARIVIEMLKLGPVSPDEKQALLAEVEKSLTGDDEGDVAA